MKSTITKQHFKDAALLVNGILNGEWTHDMPVWADKNLQAQVFELDTTDSGNVSVDYVRAAWTAETFVIFFSQWNPRFNRETFLKACGF